MVGIGLFMRVTKYKFLYGECFCLFDKFEARCIIDYCYLRLCLL